MTDQRALHELLDELRATARQLTEQQHHPILNDDTGTITNHPVPSLLQQLRDSIAHGGENGASRGKSNPIPLDPAAFDMLTQITTAAAALHLHTLRSEPYEPEDRIRAVVALAGHCTEPHQIAWITTQLRRWADQIREHLNPTRRLEIAAACPACATRMVWRHKDGEDVQVPALTVDGTTGCTCLACHHTWPPHTLEHLALVLGCDPIDDHDHRQAG